MLSKTKAKKKYKRVVAKKSKKNAAQKTTKSQAQKNTKSILTKAAIPDKAHSPGHRKMNFIDIGEATITKMRIHDSALNTPTRAELDKRKNTKTRRIISGAAIDKTGRITIKE